MAQPGASSCSGGFAAGSAGLARDCTTSPLCAGSSSASAGTARVVRWLRRVPRRAGSWRARAWCPTTRGQSRSGHRGRAAWRGVAGPGLSEAGGRSGRGRTQRPISLLCLAKSTAPSPGVCANPRTDLHGSTKSGPERYGAASNHGHDPLMHTRVRDYPLPRAACGGTTKRWGGRSVPWQPATWWKLGRSSGRRRARRSRRRRRRRPRSRARPTRVVSTTHTIAENGHSVGSRKRGTFVSVVGG
jgi:hypothetical protein